MAKKAIKKVEEEKVEVKQIEDNDYEELSIEERIINIEKKVVSSFWLNIANLVLILFILILFLGGGESSTTAGGNTGNSSTETQDVSYDTSAFISIKPSDIEKESKGKTMVLWIGRQSCGYCAMYEPYIREAANNYGIKAYYIDLGTIVDFNTSQPYITDDEAFNTLSSLTGNGEWKNFAKDNIGGTPLTLIIKDNKVIGGLSGYAEVSAIEAAFSKAGIKK